MANERDVQAARDAVISAARRLTNLWQAEDMLHPKYFEQEQAIVSTQLEDAVHDLNILELNREFEGAPETPEEVDAYLRSHGYDPDTLVAEMRARIMPMLEKKRRELDALQAEPPAGEDSREPELPPRNAEWRGHMSRAAHEDGC